MTSTPSPGRRAVRVVDVVVGIGLALLSGLIALIVLNYLQQYPVVLSPLCEGVAPDGARCNADYLNGAVIIGSAGIVFGWFIPIGFMLVRFVQRRLGFFLPIVATIIVIVVFWVTTAAISPYQA